MCLYVCVCVCVCVCAKVKAKRPYVIKRMRKGIWEELEEGKERRK